jgi:hypothetical protein
VGVTRQIDFDTTVPGFLNASRLPLLIPACRVRAFTPVLAKHSKSFSLIDCLSVGVDRIQRNFQPMRKVEAWQRGELDGTKNSCRNDLESFECVCVRGIIVHGRYRVVLIRRLDSARRPWTSPHSRRDKTDRSVDPIMPKKRAGSAALPSDRCFVMELAGETPPTFSAMERLYGLASKLYGLRPWQLLDESQLILVRDSASSETCYCSIMGALGEVYAMHAYIGTQSFRLFRRMEAEEITDAGEFFASQHSVVRGVRTPGRTGATGLRTAR